LALVTDGCASYAILGYIQISWGSSEDARVRKFSKKNKFFFTLHPSGQNRQRKQLEGVRFCLFGTQNTVPYLVSRISSYSQWARKTTQSALVTSKTSALKPKEFSTPGVAYLLNR